MKTPLLFACLLGACVPPPITVPDALEIARTERTAREVELCVLLQETYVRPRWQGVAELSFEPWHYAISSIAVRHPAGLLIMAIHRS